MKTVLVCDCIRDDGNPDPECPGFDQCSEHVTATARTARRPVTPDPTWVTCDACGGYGAEVFGTRVYEPGCGFAHDSSDERPCEKCHGNGGWIKAKVDLMRDQRRSSDEVF